VRLLKRICFVLALTFISTQSYAQSDEKIAVGIQLGNFSSGLSAKYRFTDTITGQGTLGFFGQLTKVGARGLYAFNTGPNYEIFGFGAINVFRFDGSFLVGSETVVGLGVGAGIEYDLRGLAETLPPLFVSFELGFNLVNFDNFGGFSSFGQGIALHYRF